MADQPLIISSLASGRNGIDQPTSEEFPFDQCVEALNVDFRNGGLGRKRGGMYDVQANTTGDIFTQPILTLARHVPSGDETQGEVWAWEGNTAPNIIEKITPPSTVWSVITGGLLTANIEKITTVSFNGKLFIFGDTAADRLAVYDAVLNKIRYVGIDPGTAPPAPIDAGAAGAYPAILRYYRVRWLQLSGTTIVRRSEPTPSAAFTPGGGWQYAGVYRPAPPGEGETHWEMEASPDNVNWYVIFGQRELTYAGASPIATTFVLDGLAVSAYANYSLSHIAGTYTLVPSARFGVTDGNRLLIGNLFETSHGSRVAWTPVLGSLDAGDDERLFQTSTIKPYLDLDEKNGGDLTGMAQINGVIYCFKFRQNWRLSPTGDINAPYLARRLSGVIGAVSHKSIALGEDATGNPALYFMSHRGPYRVGVGGIEYLGRDIEDITRTNSGLPNVNTVATLVISHAVFHADLFQYWVWFSTGSNNSPDKLAVLDVKRATRKDEYGIRGGWSQHTGLIATAVCSVMGPYALVATAALRPWVGLPGTNKIAICDRDDLFTDTGTLFQAYVKTRSVAPFGRLFRVSETVLMLRHHTTAGVTIRQTLDRDFGLELSTADQVGAAADIDKTLIQAFDASTIADCTCLQIQLGDVAAVDSAWDLRQLKVPVYLESDQIG